ncbi:MAG: transcriptional regulator [Candidatus Thorarchaeota archaeon]
MNKDPILSLIFQAKLNEAYDIISQNEDTNASDKIYLAIILRFQGKLKNSLETINELLEDRNVLEKNDLIKCLLIQCLNYFEINQREKADLFYQEIKKFVNDKNKLDFLDIYWNYIWLLVQGKKDEYIGKYFSAISLYGKAINLLDNVSSFYDKMFINFFVGSVYRKIGAFNQARKFLEKSLKIASEINNQFRKAQYLTSLSEILFLRDNKNYNTALNNLLTALPIWKELNLSFGISWAIHDLGILYQLRGESAKAYDYLKTAWNITKDNFSIQYKVKTLLSLIEILVEVGNEQEANNYFKDLLTLVDNNPDFSYEIRIARGMIKRLSKRLGEKISAQNIFHELSTEEKFNFEYKMKVLLNHLELILVELKYVQSKEASQEAGKLLQKLSLLSEQSFDLIVHTSILQAEFAKINNNYDQAISILTQAKELAEQETLGRYMSFIDSELAKLMVFIENDDIRDSLDPLLHSIPRLSIILYLLPRNNVTFSELQRATNLTQGNISNHTNKLLKENYISSEKQFINTKLVTVYNMTDKGIIAFDNYSHILNGLIHSYLTE